MTRSTAPHPRVGLKGQILLALIAAYALGALYVLSQGLAAAAAAAWPGFHDLLHDRAAVGGVLARTAERVAGASHDLASPSRVAIDFAVSMVNLGIAGLAVWLRPRDRSAWLLALALVGAAGIFNLTSQGTLESLPLTAFEGALQGGAHVIAGLAYVYALVLFPDGRVVPEWRRSGQVALFLPLTAVAIVLSLRAEGAARAGVLLLFFGLAVPLAGVGAQAYRLRHARDVTTQAQARLLFWALFPALGIGIGFLATQDVTITSTTLIGRNVFDPPVVVYRVFQIAFLTIPLALFAGIIRYRLWDIERLVNKTFVYALATGFLGAVYGTFVVVVQFSVGQLASNAFLDAKLTVAVITLLLASAFRPVRDRVQRVVDRRFNRARYDAALTLEHLSTRLQSSVGTESVIQQIEAVLIEVMGPAHVTVWIPGVGSPHNGTREAVPELRSTSV